MSCKYITPAEASRRVGVNPSTVYRWLNKRELPFLRLPSGRIRIAECDLIKVDIQDFTEEEYRIQEEQVEP